MPSDKKTSHHHNSTDQEEHRHRRKKQIPKKKLQVLPNALREIKHLQQQTGHLIPRLPFARVVREIMLDMCDSDFRVQLKALEALQEATEMYLTQFLEDAYRCALHRQRVTLMPIDMQLVRIIRGISDLGNR